MRALHARRAGRDARTGLPRRRVGAIAATRCGFVALIGAPNAGKSTLINRLVGTKVSIVSRKVQTTRALVRGIALDGGAQIIFVDTPGIFAPKRRLDRAMVSTAWSGAGDADVAALLVDARKGDDEETTAIMEGLGKIRGPKVLILNKIDTVEIGAAAGAGGRRSTGRRLFDETFMISALKGHGVAKLVDASARCMPAGPWLYPEDQVSDAPIRSLAAEITREKMFERLHDELPYQSTVETELWKEQPDGSGACRADDLRHARRAQEDRHRRGRPHHQGDRQRGAQGDHGGGRAEGAPVPLRQSARQLGRRPRALPHDGFGLFGLGFLIRASRR